MNGKRRSNIARAAVVLLLFVLLAWWLMLPLSITAALLWLESWIARLGSWGPAVFVLMYVLAVVLLVPGSLLALAAGLVLLLGLALLLRYVFLYFIGGGTYNIRWFVEKFAGVNTQMLGLDLSPEQVLEAAADMLPPGSEGLLFLPYLMGERSPVWDARASGSFVGLGGFIGPGAQRTRRRNRAEGVGAGGVVCGGLAAKKTDTVVCGRGTTPVHFRRRR